MLPITSTELQFAPAFVVDPAHLGRACFHRPLRTGRVPLRQSATGPLRGAGGM